MSISDRIDTSYSPESDHDDSDAFESLADLFTMLSFTLIMAVIIFGITELHVAAMERSDNVALDYLQRKGSERVAVPPNVLIMVLHSEGGLTTLRMASSVVGDTTVFSSDRHESIAACLDSIGDQIQIANRLELIVRAHGDRFDAVRLVEAQQWLAKRKRRVRLSFEAPDNDGS